MLPLIPPRSYTDPATFEQERERIFQRRWIFAALTSELAAPDAFRTLDIAGVPVVLQNFDGEIRAFTNVCSHRFARLQTEPCGQRALKCPYHGWIYNAEGLPYAIPRKPFIAEVTPATLCDYRLTRWAVRTLGPFVFVKRMVEGEPLPADDFETQLADFFAPLAELAAACGEVVENTEYTVAANWKTVVENTLEGYHVDCVHPTTIKKLGMVGLTKTTGDDDARPETEKPAASRFEFSGQNSAAFSPIDPEVSARLDRAYKFLAERPQRLDGYRHYFCFPNFVFASTRGESFSIQRILPIDEKTTRLTSYLFATNGLRELSKMEAALRRQFYAAAAEFVQAIFAEDAAICAQVQSAVAHAPGRGVLSDEEERICHFHHAYEQAMRVEKLSACAPIERRFSPPNLTATSTQKTTIHGN